MIRLLKFWVVRFLIWIPFFYIVRYGELFIIYIFYYNDRTKVSIIKNSINVFKLDFYIQAIFATGLAIIISGLIDIFKLSYKKKNIIIVIVLFLISFVLSNIVSGWGGNPGQIYFPIVHGFICGLYFILIKHIVRLILVKLGYEENLSK